jgi:ABC-type multidrug transport system permease subunit
MGLFMSAMCNDFIQCQSLGPLLVMPMMLFSGYIVNANTLPSFIYWVQYLSPIFFANQAISYAQWHDSDEAATAYLKYLGFHINYWWSLFALLMMAIVWRVLGIWTLNSKVSKFQ